MVPRTEHSTLNTAVLREDILEDTSTEALWVELKSKKGAITIMGLYCRPFNSQRDIEDSIRRQITDGCKSHRMSLTTNIEWELCRAGRLEREEFVRCNQEGVLHSMWIDWIKEGPYWTLDREMPLILLITWDNSLCYSLTVNGKPWHVYNLHMCIIYYYCSQNKEENVKLHYVTEQKLWADHWITATFLWPTIYLCVVNT